MVRDVEGVVLVKEVGDLGCNVNGIMVRGGGESCLWKSGRCGIFIRCCTCGVTT